MRTPTTSGKEGQMKTLMVYWQYFLKGSSFELIKGKQLQEAIDKINNRHRKRFDFLSPSEKFYQLTNINCINNDVAFIS